MAHSVKWLTSGEAATARYKRLTDGQTHPMITHQYVVHVELNGNCENLERFQEVDADSEFQRGFHNCLLSEQKRSSK